MFEVDHTNIMDYFRGIGREFAEALGLDDQSLAVASAQTLAWGVSNLVIRIDTPQLSLVVKQSRHQLRTKIDWFSRIDRIWREVDVLRSLLSISTPGSVPQVLFEDRDNYLYGMQAIAADHRVWKGELLAGHVEPAIAVQLGKWLAQVHRATSGSEALRNQLGDRTVFDELRLDPFYRYVATHHEVVRTELTSLISDALARQDCLVLADFSPKNILLTQSGPVVVDFETGHYGDPGFDLGFFLSHLLLKTVLWRDRMTEYLGLAREFWATYQQELVRERGEQFAINALDSESQATSDWTATPEDRARFDAQCVRHLGACMLARIDGKSRVDYLTEEGLVPLVRTYCHRLLCERISTVNEAFEILTRLISRS